MPNYTEFYQLNAATSMMEFQWADSFFYDTSNRLIQKKGNGLEDLYDYPMFSMKHTLSYNHALTPALRQESWVTFDGNGNVATSEIYLWDNALQTMKGIIKGTSVHNGSGWVMGTSYKWLSGTNWQPQSHFEYLFPYQNPNAAPTGLVSESYLWDSVTQNFVLSWQSTYHGRTCGSVGIQNEMAENHCFNLSPNPANHELQLSSETIAQADVKIYDMQHRLVATHQFADHFARINIRHLPTGIYLLSLSNDKQYAYQKFVKE